MAYEVTKDRYLIISDLQMPFEHPKALEFCKYLASHFKIDVNNYNVICVGDETDQYYGGMWKKDINANHTALSEIKETKEKLAPWFDAFPKMKLCTSNHGTRWQRLALESSIPSVLMRRYEEVLGCPDTWIWQKRWNINTKHPFTVEHGDDYGTQYPHVLAAMHNAKSTVIGHHHSIGGIEHIQTNGMRIWGCASGSLIDFEAYAFNYARSGKRKPVIGTNVILDSGAMPIWCPL